MRETMLRILARVFSRGYRWIFSGAGLLLVLVGLLFALKPPHLQSDILDLLPQKSGIVQDFRLATEDFKSLDYLFVVLESTDPTKHPIDDYEDFADAFAEELRQSGMVDGVEYCLKDYERIIFDLLPYTLLYLAPQDLAEVANRFSDDQIKTQTAVNRQLLGSPASTIVKQLVQYDPFGLLPILKRHFLGRSRQLKVDISDGYYLSKDGTSLILIVRPSRPSQDIPFGRKLMKVVREIETRLRREQAEDDDGALGFLKIKYGGGYPIAQDDVNLIKRDGLVNTLSSIILVMFIYLWAFRRKSSLIYGWLPLLFGLVITFGAAHLLGATLNSATAGVGALLIGLGIDFSTVIYGRYIEERNRGAAVEDAIVSAMGKTGTGVMVGAITTACTFGAMMVTSFNGMRQVGIITSMGILFCCGSVFILLPAMLFYHQVHASKRGDEATFHMGSFGFNRLALWSHRHPVATLVIAGLLTAGFGLAALDVRLEDNVQSLRSPSNTGINVTREVGQTFGATLTYMMAVLESDTPDGIVLQSEKVLEAIKPFQADGTILFTDSLGTYLPPMERQQRIIDSLRNDPQGRFSFDRIRATFIAACQKNGFEVETFSSYLTVLERMLHPERPVTYNDLARSPLSPILRKFIIEKNPNFYRGIVCLYIPEQFKRYEPTGLSAAIKQAVPGAKVVGINLLSQSLRGMIKQDARVSFILGSIIAFIIIMADFRAFRPAIYSILPLCVGLLWMLGSMRLMNEPLNMMNIYVTTMIIGIGSDYGIYFVHRFLEADGFHMDRVIREIGSPIVIAALTTIAGFGSLSLSSYPGLRSIGYVSLLGTLYSMVATMTVLVALLTLIEKRRPLVQPTVGRDNETP